MPNPFPYDHMRGKMFSDLPQSELKLVPKKTYIASTKYDGNRIFIVKHKGTLRLFTSDWKEFELPVTGSTHILQPLFQNKEDFVLEAEFNYTNEGKLGNRRQSAILTTFRTQFKKGCKVIDSRARDKIFIKVFDCLLIVDNVLETNVPYETRLENSIMLFKPDCVKVISYIFVEGDVIDKMTKSHVSKGWEGCMFVEAKSTYSVGKRVNYVIKNKLRPTVDLLCIGTQLGEIGSKYEGMIGSLLLEDSQGRKVLVGSGLSDDQRNLSPDLFIGKVVEIAYEQIMDTYIQPTFVDVRESKGPGEID